MNARTLLRCGAVAIIDDDRMVADLLAEMLQPRTAYVFNSGETAWNWFIQHPFNRVVLVIADYNLPGLSGLEAIRKIRALNPARRFILMSGSSVESMDRLVRQNRCDAFLLKPVTTLDLQQMVEIVLRKDGEEGPSGSPVTVAAGREDPAAGWGYDRRCHDRVGATGDGG